MALAHAVGDKIEAAYRRGDLFDKRVALMSDWADFLLPHDSISVRKRVRRDSTTARAISEKQAISSYPTGQTGVDPVAE